MFMTRDAWLAERPYLNTIAKLHDVISAAAGEASISSVKVPLLDPYRDEFRAGVPLLLNSAVRIDVRPAETALVTFVEHLADRPMPEGFVQEVRDFAADLRGDTDLAGHAIAWLLQRSTFPPRNPALLHFLGWIMMARYLNPLVNAFAAWREEESWLRNYCPTCASPPAMAQILRAEPASLRFLTCGDCGTRWRFPRTRCPFCETEDDHLSATMAIDGEHALQIAFCNGCKGYLKTCSGEQYEPFLLDDWTSLHLDVIAQDHGLKRYAASRYHL